MSPSSPAVSDVPKEDLDEALPSRAAAVHEIIRREGEKELRRDFFALFWSAIAAGLTMSTSFMGVGILRAHLPAGPASGLVEAAGYALGFIFVICAGQQLFTENTVTPVLPLMARPSLRTLGKLLRLWGSVLLGNVIGCLVAAAVFAFLPMFPPAVDQAFREIGHHLIGEPLAETFAKAILAGWLIATLVWMIHAVESGRIVLTFLVAYLMGIADVTHVIVGTIEAGYSVFLGEAGVADALLHFALPTLVGNVIGGTAIFALISHAQVRADVDMEAPARH